MWDEFDSPVELSPEDGVPAEIARHLEVGLGELAALGVDEETDVEPIVLCLGGSRSVGTFDIYR